VRTGDGPTEDAGGATRDEENVIRLPRDWLGPPEELIPIGPAARARAAQLEAGAPPPAADAFWSEDAAALHDAVQAPQKNDRTPANPPVGLVAPVAGRWQFRLPRLPRRAVRRRVRTGWALLMVPAVALAVLAAIGFGEQPRTGVSARRVDGVRDVVSTPAPKASMAAAASLLAKRAAASTRHRVRRRASVSRARTHARQSATHRARARHRAGPIHHPAAAPTAAVVQASTPSQTSGGASSGSTASQTSTPVTTTTPASETASKPSAGGSRPAPPPGPTGIGSMTGGCTVKCS
jgi:hypothetical protein